MIDKLLTLKNIGIFNELKIDRNYWNTEFKKNNLIYAENGQGKTTLSVIFESLSKGNAELLIGRKTLGATGKQTIEFMSEKKKIKYENGIWSQQMSNIEIFNARFVTENLYMGDTINSEQKRNLQSFVLGAEGINLINQINSFDEKIKVVQSEIKSGEKILSTHIGKTIKIEAFIDLPQIENIDEQIKQLEITLKNLEQSEEIAKHPELADLGFELPKPSIISQLLVKSYDDISKEAEILVSEHVKGLNNKDAESWVNQGLKMTSNDKCPFCASDVSNNELIQAYKKYFNQKYNEYKNTVTSQIETIKNGISEANLLRFRKIISDNIKDAEYWNSKMDSSVIPTFNEEMFAVLESLSVKLDCVFEAKKSDILSPVVLPEEVANILEQVEAEVAFYHGIVIECNSKIKGFKQKIGTIKKQDIVDKLDKLKLAKRRYDKEINNVCEDYKENTRKKQELTKSKAAVREQLDKYIESFKSTFGAEINKILVKFGAGFSICEIDTDYRSGPKFEYKLSINGQPFCLNDSKNRERVPQFKNTLSEGDKTTLAFAFFISKLEKSPTIANTIVVIDDPISSLDIFRMNMTAGVLHDLFVKVEQIFVLTHDLIFAKKYFDRTHHGNNLLMLEIYKKQFRSFNIDKVHLSEYTRNYYILDDYVNNNSEESSLSVARAIRPLIEGHLRMHYPKHFTCNKWLGDFIVLLRDATNVEPYFGIKDKLSEIEDLNEYSKQFHHENANSQQINQTELRNFAELALKFCS